MSRTQNIGTSTIAGTIAYRNTELANKFLVAAGYGPSRGSEEIAYKLNAYIAKFGDEALAALKEIHPDRELLTPAVVANPVAAQNVNMNASGDGFMNCSGCKGGCGLQQAPKQHFNVAGDEGEKLRSTNLIDTKSIMLVGIFCITAISIVAIARKG